MLELLQYMEHKMKHTIYNAQTNETIEIPFTKEEIAQFEKTQKELIAEEETIKAEAEVKATAKAALLAQLGITEEQAKLLLS